MGRGMKRKRIAQALLGGAVGFNLRAKAATKQPQKDISRGGRGAGVFLCVCVCVFIIN